jgi:hypothetical protein
VHTSRLMCKFSSPFLKPLAFALHMPLNSCLGFGLVHTFKLLCGLPFTLWGLLTHVQTPAPILKTFDSQFACDFWFLNGFVGYTHLLTPMWILIHTLVTFDAYTYYHPYCRNLQLLCRLGVSCWFIQPC